MTSPNTAFPPVSGEAAALVAQLAKEAHRPDILVIDNADGALGKGLPTGIPALWNPRAGRLESVAALLNDHRLHPERKTGKAIAMTLYSFMALVNRHKTPHSAVFADTNWRAPKLMAVIDYHQVNQFAADRDDLTDAPDVIGNPDFGQHRIAYAFPLSEEWQQWMAQNAQPMGQADFAAFLEDHIAELASPTEAEKIALERDFATTVAEPSQLIALSRGLQINVDSTVKNAQILQSGEMSILFEETHKDSTGRPLKVPGMFMLRIAPFFMGETITLPVRLRYRVSGGKLTWLFQMYRPDVHVTERVRDDLHTVGIKTALPCFEAVPEMST